MEAISDTPVVNPTGDISGIVPDSKRDAIQNEVKTLSEADERRVKKVIDYALLHLQQDFNPALVFKSVLFDTGRIDVHIFHLKRVSVADQHALLIDLGKDESSSPRIQDSRFCATSKSLHSCIDCSHFSLCVQLVGKEPLTIFDIEMPLLDGPNVTPSAEMLAKFKQSVAPADFQRVFNAMAIMAQHPQIGSLDILSVNTHYRLIADFKQAEAFEMSWRWFWKVFAQSQTYADAASTFVDFETGCLAMDIIKHNAASLPRPEFKHKRKLELLPEELPNAKHARTDERDTTEA